MKSQCSGRYSKQEIFAHVQFNGSRNENVRGVKGLESECILESFKLGIEQVGYMQYLENRLSKSELRLEITVPFGQDGNVFSVDELILFKNKTLEEGSLKGMILDKMHKGKFTVHSGYNEDVLRFEDDVLVVRNEKRCNGICD